MLQVLCKVSDTGIGVLPKNLLDLHRLSAAGFGDGDQFPVGVSQFLFGLLILAKRYAMELLRKRLTLRLRVRKASLPKLSATSAGNAFFTLLSRRLMTLTPSPSSLLSVGGWTTSVSTTVESTLSFLPRVTFEERASSTARSLRAVSVSGPMVFAHRMRVVSSGALSRYSRQNYRKTIESETKYSVCS